MGNKSNELQMHLYSKKKGAMRIWPDWWSKRPRICWMWNQPLPNYNVFSDWWKLASWIFLGKREKMRVCYWFEREIAISDDYIA